VEAVASVSRLRKLPKLSEQAVSNQLMVEGGGGGGECVGGNSTYIC
jgi:hypothetical protein